jgi:hypothetical protein
MSARSRLDQPLKDCAQWGSFSSQDADRCSSRPGWRRLRAEMMPLEAFETPFRKLPMVEISVDENERLGDVLDLAAVEFGTELPGGTIWGSVAFIDFAQSDDSTVWGRLHSEVTLVDSQGHLRWSRYWQLEPMSEYIRAAKAGALQGDPLRPFLIMQPGVGNGVLADFGTYLQLWNVIWDVMTDVGTIYTLAAGAKLTIETIKERCRRGQSVVENHLEDWKASGARPDNLIAWLRTEPRRSADVARLLACSPEEAEALLLGAGFSIAEGDVWISGLDEEARLIAGNTDLIIHAPNLMEDDIRRLVRERVYELIESGTVSREPDFEATVDLPRDPEFQMRHEASDDDELLRDEMARAIEEARERR